MSRALRIRLTIGVIVVLLVVTPFLIPVNQFRPTFEQRASAALGRRVDMGRLRFSLLSGSLSAETLTIGDDPPICRSRRLTTNLRVAADGLRFEYVNGVVPSLGHLTGAGTIDARNNLHFGMVTTLVSPPGGGIGAAVGTSGALNEGPVRIPFLVLGPTSNPQFAPDVGGLVMQTLEEQLGTKR